MTIHGLTDRGMAFPQIGNIRKGDKVKNAQGIEHPRDLQWFRVEFDERETDAIANFARAYPNQKPTEINVFLPFNEIERCWDAWCEAYTAGRMIARSDGEYFLFLVDLQTNGVIVHDGVDANGAKVPHREVIGQAGKTVIKCRPVGRLKVIIPELRRLAYIVVHTTSVIDIRNLSDQLEAIKQINGGQIVGIPLVLKRRPHEISVPNPDGTKRRLIKWMLSIEADPRWVAKKLDQLDRLALPEGPNRPALPAISEETDGDEGPEWDEIDGEWNEEETTFDQSTAVTPPTNGNGHAPVTPPAQEEGEYMLDAALLKAEAVISSSSKQPYGVEKTEALSYRINAMKAKKTPDEDQLMRIAAIEIILAARTNGRPVQTLQPLEGQEPLL